MFYTSDNPHVSLIINGIAIAQDSAGRYRITDLHKASGGEDQHKPLNWLRNHKTQELAESIRKKHFSDLRSEVMEAFEPVNTINGGDYPGTYVHEDLVIDYAMWISPDFKLRVIQAFREQQLKLTHSPDSFFYTHLSKENQLLKEQIALLKTAIHLKKEYLNCRGKAVEDADSTTSTPPPPPSADTPQLLPTDPHPPIDPPWLAILKHWSQAVRQGAFTTFHRDRIKDEPVVLVRLNQILQYVAEESDSAQSLLKYSVPAFKRELRAHGILRDDRPHERNIDGRRVSNLRALNLHVLKQLKAWDVE